MQTIPEKLRLLAIIIEAGEQAVLIGGSKATPFAALSSIAMFQDECPVIERIVPQIKVGKIKINSPLRVAPRAGTKYHIATADGRTEFFIWDGDAVDKRYLNNGACWATKEDAQAYQDASFEERKG